MKGAQLRTEPTMTDTKQAERMEGDPMEEEPKPAGEKIHWE